MTDMVWNCSGSIVAASYGRYQHEGSCSDKAFVYCWHISKRNFDTDSPTYILESNTCIMSLEFHPTRSTWLAGGSFQGQVYLWDISRQD